MKYAVMTRDLKSTFLGPDYNAVDAYNGWMKRHIIDKGSTDYGAVLVQMKPVTVGYKLIISFDWEFLKYKFKPRFERYIAAFTWLWFYIAFEKVVSDKPDKIVQDHIAEIEEGNK
jgi:hypothetical protein